MMSVGSSEAKTHLPELLERVARGEKILITRRGVPVAMLTQPPQRVATKARSAKEIREIVKQMLALRETNNLGSDLSIRDLIKEGRRF